MDYPLYVQFALRKDYNILTDSVYCVRLFTDNSIKGRCNSKQALRITFILVRRVLSRPGQTSSQFIDRMDQFAHWSSHAGSHWECGSGSPSGAREDGLNHRGGHGVRPSPTCPRIASNVYVREYAATRFRNCS